MKRDAIYPLPFAARDLPSPVPDGDELFVPLGHDLYVGLVEMVEDECRRAVTLDGLRALRLDAYGGHVVAGDNLARFTKDARLQAFLYRTKRQQPFVVWQGHWLAASCCQLPHLFKLSCKQLQTDQMCLSVPHREVLMVFPLGDRASRDEMRALVRAHECHGREPLTFDLFALQADGVSAFFEEE